MLTSDVILVIADDVTSDVRIAPKVFHQNMALNVVASNSQYPDIISELQYLLLIASLLNEVLEL